MVASFDSIKRIKIIIFVNFFKLKVIKCAEEQVNTAAERQFSVGEKMVKNLR